MPVARGLDGLGEQDPLAACGPVGSKPGCCSQGNKPAGTCLNGAAFGAACKPGGAVSSQKCLYGFTPNVHKCRPGSGAGANS
jgi:hypothetical protein